MNMTKRQADAAVERTSRRSVIQGAAGLAAVLAVAGASAAAAQSATPAANAGRPGPVAVQTFGKGSLFPTQGDGPDLPPYTAILWDATDRGVVVADPVAGAIGVVPAERVVEALTAAGTATAALVARLPAGSERDEGIWLLTLTSGGLGADPGAVTYQGEPPASSDNEASSDAMSDALPDGVQDLESGFLIVYGLPDLIAAGVQSMLLPWD
jgi:hypothetical protein